MKKKAYSLLLIFVVFVITVSNVKGLLQNYYGFYYPDKEDEKLASNLIYPLLSRIQEVELYNYFTTYTGLETGYGFFAPNVASDFIVDFEVLDSKNNSIAKVNFVPLANKESYVRLTTSYSLFLYSEQKNKTEMEKQKSRLLLKGLAYQNLIAYPEATKIRANLYLYHYPTLEQLQANKLRKPLMILSGSSIYTYKDYENWN